MAASGLATFFSCIDQLDGVEGYLAALSGLGLLSGCAEVFELSPGPGGVNLREARTVDRTFRGLGKPRTSNQERQKFGSMSGSAQKTIPSHVYGGSQWRF
jgi:hypothetical protein